MKWRVYRQVYGHWKHTMFYTWVATHPEHLGYIKSFESWQEAMSFVEWIETR